jgi:glutathione-regulated potassium-efflux system ancillary protein KefG
MRVLVLFAHPALEKSRVNRRLIAAAGEVEGVTVHDLYEAYPDLHIDVRREQVLLEEHDAIVFQHPLYWYSTPSILKEWQDLVLQHGWAYGTGGRALEGKVTFNAVSAGGPESAYRPEGHNRFTLRQLLVPWEATARLCLMRYLPPFVVFAALRMKRASELDGPAGEYRRLLEALVADRVDVERAAPLERLNAEALEALLLDRAAAAAGGG